MRFLEKPKSCPQCGQVWSTETRLSWWLEYDRCYGCMQPADSDRFPDDASMEQYRRVHRAIQLSLFDEVTP